MWLYQPEGKSEKVQMCSVDEIRRIMHTSFYTFKVVPLLLFPENYSCKFDVLLA